MSFSSITKDELVSSCKLTNKEEKRSLLCGVTHAAGSMTLGRGGVGLKYVTENTNVAALTAKLGKELYAAEAVISISEKERLNAVNTVVSLSGEGVMELLRDASHRQRERKAFDWNAELSIYLSDQAFGTGAGKALYGALYALLRMQHIHTLHAYITYPNPQSVSFHRKMGFEMAYIQKNAGYKLDKWHDLAWMICQLDPSDAEDLHAVHHQKRSQL